jgi:hypothetical protein
MIHPVTRLALIAAAFTLTLRAPAQGLPAEAREEIQSLFAGHARITRNVVETPEGYTATTESEDPALARILQSHVKRMETRLKDGLMVRRWDPAFAEYVEHYDEMTHTITPTEKGLKITVTGRNPKAIAVARNHAKVVSGFVTDGDAAHHRQHPAVGDAVPAVKPGEEKATDVKPEVSAKPAAACGAGCAGNCGKEGGCGKDKGAGCGKGCGKGKTKEPDPTTAPKE